MRRLGKRVDDAAAALLRGLALHIIVYEKYDK